MTIPVRPHMYTTAMNRSPFHALCADLPDSEEVFEPFYPEDSFVPTISRSPQTSPPIHVNRFFCPEKIDLKSWTNKHPEHWGPREVLDWVYCVADKFHISGMRGEMFNRKTGSELCRFTREQFLRLEPNYGDHLHGCLHRLLRDSNFRPPIHMDIATPANMNETFWPSSTMAMTSRDHHSSAHNNNAPRQAEVAVKLNGTVYDIDLKESFIDIKEEPVYSTMPLDVNIKEECGYSTREWTPQCHYTPQHEVPVFRETRDPRLPSLELFEGATELRPWRRPCGRPRKRSCDSLSSDGEACFRTPRGRRPGHMSKGNHLWEFVRDLLANPMHNPSLVRWEDQANGVFRFVQSEKVARLWGEKKNNKSMTYEKLSRAMRFCRSAGHFAQLPKSEQFPKKLCFKFGPKALKWRCF